MNFRFRKLQGKHEGNFDFEGNHFIYNLYLQPLSEIHKDEVADFFGNRKTYNATTQRDESCLNTGTNDIREYLAPNNNYGIWVFGKVWLHKEDELNDDIGSGTLQLADHLLTGNDQYWISDVCRTRDNDKEKSKVSPIPALFYLFEQLILQKMNETKIWLMVNGIEDIADPPGILEKIYTKYGFHKSHNLQVGEISYKIMYKDIEPINPIKKKRPIMVEYTAATDTKRIKTTITGGIIKRKSKKKTRKIKNNYLV